jgi:hypothetical protein
MYLWQTHEFDPTSWWWTSEVVELKMGQEPVFMKDWSNIYAKIAMDCIVLLAPHSLLSIKILIFG